MKEKIEKFFAKLVGYIACVWLIIWIVPLIICGFMIDILLAFFGLESEYMCVKNFGLWLRKVGTGLKLSKNNNNQEIKEENE